MKEIENVDQALYNQGFVDVSIGNVGLERLKKTAHTIQVAQTIPSLLYIIPYFEVSQNQEYVVQRIRGKQINNNGNTLCSLKKNSILSFVKLLFDLPRLNVICRRQMPEWRPLKKRLAYYLFSLSDSLTHAQHRQFYFHNNDSNHVN